MNLQGGEIWKEGADTCVFKPAVRCEGETESTPNSVSRIVPTEKATRDLEVENLIRTSFPELVELSMVTIHTKACVPDYTKQDLEYDKTFAPKDRHGCDELNISIESGVERKHTNMVTPYRGETFFRFLQKNAGFRPTWKSLISDILQAAITMVPDDGPWIIHTDCHLNNVLTIPKTVGEAPALTLSDWGRALVIQNPKDIESVRQGIREWARSIPYLGISETESDDKQIVNSIRRNIGDYPQHPLRYHDLFASVFSDSKEIQDMGIRKLRTWLPYVLITGTQSEAMRNGFRDNMFEKNVYDAISIKSSSQQELGDNIFQLLYQDGVVSEEGPTSPVSAPPGTPSAGGMYWPVKYYRGLTRKQNLQRKRSATRRTKMSFKNPKAYVPFKSDKGAKTRKSSYTERFHKKYPGVKSLSEIAKATGISKSILQTVYDRGMAAWRTGHRPGASQQAWGMARVHSFAMKGKTYRTADADLARKV